MVLWQLCGEQARSLGKMHIDHRHLRFRDTRPTFTTQDIISTDLKKRVHCFCEEGDLVSIQGLKNANNVQYNNTYAITLPRSQWDFNKGEIAVVTQHQQHLRLNANYVIKAFGPGQRADPFMVNIGTSYRGQCLSGGLFRPCMRWDPLIVYGAPSYLRCVVAQAPSRCNTRLKSE